ncbi:MAG: hypothetical protein IT357_02095 [Gemmatimonadaceae bacterium]|nr:hypothetical protein [Gemmatimonadaceae bacterium]
MEWLLGRLKPEVLFLEHPASALNSFRDLSCGTLESAAAMSYLRSHDAELVPVDIDVDEYECPASELKELFDEMFMRCAEVSGRFAALEAIHSFETERGGFAYLNSPVGWQYVSELAQELRTVVALSSEPRLAELYGLWERTNDRREWSMLAGVNAFARRASFNSAVLLVGAAHRPSLMEKVRQGGGEDDARVVWDFKWELDAT